MISSPFYHYFPCRDSTLSVPAMKRYTPLQSQADTTEETDRKNRPKSPSCSARAPSAP